MLPTASNKAAARTMMMILTLSTTLAAPMFTNHHTRQLLGRGDSCFSSHHTCGDCTSKGCVWCEEQKECQAKFSINSCGGKIKQTEFCGTDGTCFGGFHNCDDCNAAPGCLWCGSQGGGGECQAKGSIHKCSGKSRTCPPKPPAKLDTCVLPKDDWLLAKQAAKLSTLAGVPIAEGSNINQFGLGEGTLVKNCEGSSFAGRLFALHNHSERRCFIAFRGTNMDGNLISKVSNVMADIDAVPRKVNGLWTFEGYVGALQQVEGCLRQAITDAYNSKQCTKKETYITGHSLGGAMANLASAGDLAMWGSDKTLGGLITFGSPRPWQSSCGAVNSKLPNKNLRFVHRVFPHSENYLGFEYTGFDPVTQLVPLAMDPLAKHCGTAYSLNNIIYEGADENSGQTLNPALLNMNGPNDYFATVLDPNIGKFWYIHNSAVYSLIVDDLHKAAQTDTC